MNFFEPKKIIFLTFDFINPIFSGNGTLSRLQILGLLEQGNNVMVICPKGNIEKDFQVKEYLKKDQLKIIGLNINTSKNLSFSSDWQGYFKEAVNKMEKIEEFKPNCIISVDWHTIELASELEKKFSIPLITEFFRVFSYFKTYFESDEEYNIIRQKEIKMLKESTSSIVLSKIDKNWAIKNGQNNVHIIYPPVLDKFFSVLNKIEQPIKSSTNFNSIKKKIITVARLVPEKRILRIFPILHELIKQNYKFEYHLIGENLDNQYYLKIQDKIKELNLENYIIIRGKLEINEIIGEYINSSLYIHTSSYEPFGISIIEAALTKCPIVLDEHALIGASEVLINNTADFFKGYLSLNYENSMESAKNLIQFLEDKEQIKKTIEIAYDSAKKLTIENYQSQIQKIIQKTLDQK